MTFEPLASECTNPITGKLCPAYRIGDGKSTISRCLVEEIPDQVNPPEFCPMLKDSSSSTHNLKDGLESNYERVTRAECPNCHREFDPGNWRGPNGMRKTFCSYQCRWAYNNKIRLEAKGKLVTMAQIADTLADATKAMAREILDK